MSSGEESVVGREHIEAFGRLAHALGGQGPFSTLTLLQLIPKETGFQAAVDDLPRQERISSAVAIEVRRGIDTGVSYRRPPIAAVLLGALDHVGDAAIPEGQQALVEGMALRLD